MLYGHGDDFYNAKNEVKINFSSNVWHGANLDKLKEHLIEHFDKLTRYPEPDAATLKRLLARRYEIKEENIVVTNGSITAFYLLAQAWRGAKSMIAIPSFSEYEDACVCMSMRSPSSRHRTIYQSYPWRDRTSVGFVIRIIRMGS